MNENGQPGAWGQLSPSGLGRALLYAKRIGLARGAAKKLMARLWSRLRLRTPVDILYAGLKFRVHPWDNTVEYKLLFGSKPRDWPEITQLKTYVGERGVFLDIGANMGYYALMAAQCGATKVLAFEPNPIVFSRLKFNIDANDLGGVVSALPYALGDRADTVTLTVSQGDMGGSHIGQTGGLIGTAVEVEMKTLASVLSDHAIDRVDALKIDVEGLEDAVLLPFFESCPRSMWPRLIIIEHTSHQAWKRDVLAWLTSSGYREFERNRSNAMLRLDGHPEHA